MLCRVSEDTGRAWKIREVMSIVKVRTRKMMNRGSCIKSLLKKTGFVKSCHWFEPGDQVSQHSDLERGGGLTVGRAAPSFLGPQGWWWLWCLPVSLIAFVYPAERCWWTFSVAWVLHIRKLCSLHVSLCCSPLKKGGKGAVEIECLFMCPGLLKNYNRLETSIKD